MTAPMGDTVEFFQSEPGTVIWYKDGEGVAYVLELDGYEFPHDTWAFLSAAEWQALAFAEIEG